MIKSIKQLIEKNSHLKILNIVYNGRYVKKLTKEKNIRLLYKVRLSKEERKKRRAYNKESRKERKKRKNIKY